jgi:hypothetical protein
MFTKLLLELVSGAKFVCFLPSPTSCEELNCANCGGQENLHGAKAVFAVPTKRSILIAGNTAPASRSPDSFL